MQSRKKKKKSRNSTSYIGSKKIQEVSPLPPTSTTTEELTEIAVEKKEDPAEAKKIIEATESKLPITETVVIEPPKSKTEAITLLDTVETPKTVKVPTCDPAKKNRPNLTLNKNMVKSFNRPLIQPGDVVITSGVFDEKDDIENELIAGAHRPILVLWCDSHLARGLPLCSKPGMIGSITGHRRSAIPSTPDVLSRNVNAISYLDHGQVITFPISAVESVPVTMNQTAVEQVLLEDFKMTYVERGYNINRILNYLFEQDPKAFRLYQDNTEFYKLQDQYMELEKERNEFRRERNELVEENQKLSEQACGEAMMREQLEQVLEKQKNIPADYEKKIKEFESTVAKLESIIKTQNEALEKSKQVVDNFKAAEERHIATIEAMKKEITNLKNSSEKVIYNCNIAAAAFNAYQDAERNGIDRYQAMCCAIGIEYDPNKTRSYGQIKRQLKKLLVDNEMISPAEWV